MKILLNLSLAAIAALLLSAEASAQSRAQYESMANAFRLGVEAGRTAYEAGLMEARDFASPSTPVIGTPFWHDARLSDQHPQRLDCGQPIRQRGLVRQALRAARLRL